MEKANLFNRCPWNNWTSICGFLGGSVVKESVFNEETQVQSLGQGDSLEKEMATHSSIECVPYVRHCQAASLLLKVLSQGKN